MAASAKVPLTVTYTPESGVTSTATVLGQVLNNGATNWIPSGTNGNAIYLATDGGSGADQTAVGGDTYYITTGPALPAQATISVSQSMSGSGMAMGSGSSSQMVMGSASASASDSAIAGSESASAAASGSASQSTSPNAAGHTASTGNMGKLVCVLAFLAFGGAVAL